MIDPDDKLRALFDEAEGAYLPSHDELAHLDARMEGLLSGDAPPAPSTPSWHRLARYGAVGVGIAFLVTAAALRLGHERQPGPAKPAPVALTSPAPTPEPALPPASTLAVPTLSVDALPSVALPPPLAASARVGKDVDAMRESASPSSLAEEVRLVRAATDQRRSGDVVGALALLDEHARRFPQGVLADQRDVERIAALCDEGATAQASSRAQAFLASRPSSPLAERVRSSCAGPGGDAAIPEMRHR